jgi:hypothetical protein
MHDVIGFRVRRCDGRSWLIRIDGGLRQPGDGAADEWNNDEWQRNAAEGPALVFHNLSIRLSSRVVTDFLKHRQQKATCLNSATGFRPPSLIQVAEEDDDRNFLNRKYFLRKV